MTTQQQLDELYATRTKILTTGQAYTADGRQMTRADFKAVQDTITQLEAKLARETRGASGGGVGYIIPG